MAFWFLLWYWLDMKKSIDNIWWRNDNTNLYIILWCRNLYIILWSKHFHHNNPLSLAKSSLYRWGNWSSEKLRDSHDQDYTINVNGRNETQNDVMPDRKSHKFSTIQHYKDATWCRGKKPGLRGRKKLVWILTEFFLEKILTSQVVV